MADSCHTEGLFSSKGKEPHGFYLGIVWYKGVLPPCLGTWFGVELFVSTRALVKSCCRSDSNTTELPCMLHRVKLAFTSRESFFNLFNAHRPRRLLRLKGYLNDSFNSM